MGQRLRLKSSFVIPANWTIEEKAVLLALKKYGAIVADNGNFFSVSVCPDDRFAGNAFDHLSTIDINNFEVIQTTGPNEGPRSPGAPSVNAGPDQYVDLPASAALNGVATLPGGSGTLLWKLYSGPGAVTIANPNSANTSVTFRKPGTYTFMFSADDAVHSVAYDAAIITVRLPLTTSRDHNDLPSAFPTVVGQTYRLERSTALIGGQWTTVLDNVNGTGSVLVLRAVNALVQPRAFYRIVAL